jgi:DNA-binding MarR family transcriptional regulator
MNDPAPSGFDLQDFLPYLLNQAAEAASRGFQDIYRSRYGMTRTQWRAMANLGKFGAMTARDICSISHIEKTKVSRAVAGLEHMGLLARNTSSQDRRAEVLSLTDRGLDVFADLGREAIIYDKALRTRLGHEVAGSLNHILRAVISETLGSDGNHDE